MSGNRNQSTDREQDLAASPGVRDECYAGYRAGEALRRFYIGKREIGVSEVIDRWLDPKHSYFKVRGEDRGIYILRYSQLGDVWEMILFDSDTREDTRLSST